MTATAEVVSANLDEACYSVRDLLVVLSACRLARRPMDEAIDKLLDMVGET